MFINEDGIALSLDDDGFRVLPTRIASSPRYDRLTACAAVSPSLPPITADTDGPCVQLYTTCDEGPTEPHFCSVLLLATGVIVCRTKLSSVARGE